MENSRTFPGFPELFQNSRVSSFFQVLYIATQLIDISAHVLTSKIFNEIEF